MFRGILTKPFRSNNQQIELISTIKKDTDSACRQNKFINKTDQPNQIDNIYISKGIDVMPVKKATKIELNDVSVTNEKARSKE